MELISASKFSILPITISTDFRFITLSTGLVDLLDMSISPLLHLVPLIDANSFPLWNTVI